MSLWTRPDAEAYVRFMLCWYPIVSYLFSVCVIFYRRPCGIMAA